MVTQDDLDKLRALQDVISEKINIEQRLREIPKALSTQEEALTKLKKRFLELNAEFEKTKAKEAEKKGALYEAEALRERSEKNMDDISTQREYEALSKEIDDAKKKEDGYGRELKELDLKLADLDGKIKEEAKLIESVESELAAKRADMDRETGEKKAQIASLLEEEGRLTENLDGEIIFKFERIIRNKMGMGIVAIKGNVCMGCHMILPTQFVNSVRLAEEFIFCHYCSRILYYEEAAEEMFFDSESAGSLSDLDDLEEEEEAEEEEEEEDDYEEEEEGKIAADYEE